MTSFLLCDDGAVGTEQRHVSADEGLVGADVLHLAF